MLECPKCNFSNELGRIFCHQCGAKLDLDKIKAPTKGAKVRRRMAMNVGRLVRILFELAIIAVLLLGIVLMCQVPDIKPIEPTNAELIAADTKRMDLDQLVLGRKPGQVEITEAELNTFLHSLSFEKPKGTGLEVVPVTLRSDLGDGVVTVGFIGDIRFGTLFTKRIYLAMAGTPEVGRGSFDLKPVGGWIGSLPIHPKILELTDLFQKLLGKVFSQLDAERQSLEKLSSITVTKGQAVLKYEPAAKK